MKFGYFHENIYLFKCHIINLYASNPENRLELLKMKHLEFSREDRRRVNKREWNELLFLLRNKKITCSMVNHIDDTNDMHQTGLSWVLAVECS